MTWLIRQPNYIFLQLLILFFLCEVNHAASSKRIMLSRSMPKAENGTKSERYTFDNASLERVYLYPQVQFSKTDPDADDDDDTDGSRSMNALNDNNSDRAFTSVDYPDDDTLFPFLYQTGSKSTSYFHEQDLLFLFLIFALGATLRALSFTFNLKMIFKMVLFVLGGLYGFLTVRFEEVDAFSNLPNIQPRMLLLIFLPILLFKTAYMLDTHSFKRAIWQILILGVPGFLISSILLAAAMMYMFDYDWPFEVALLFGIIASTIYPYDVVLVLKDLGQSKHLSILLEGEALISCSTAVILCHCIVAKLLGYFRNELVIFVNVLVILVLEPAAGYVMGKLTVLMLSLVYNDPVACTTLTLVATYVTYIFTDDVLGLVGPLSVLVLGLVISSERTNFPVEIDNALNSFWEFLSFLANTTVLVLFGIIMVRVLYDRFDISHVVRLVITYILIVVCRFLMFLILSPILSRLGFGLPWRHGLIAVWGGLRGCLCLNLALVIWKVDEDYGSQFMVNITGVLLLTTCVNGCTIQYLFKYLGMTEISLAKKTNMNNAMKYLESRRERAMSMLKMDRFLADANWIVVEKHTHIEHPYKIKFEDDDDDEEDNYLGYHFTTCPSCEKEILNEPTPQEYKEMMREAKMRILKAKKVSYWRQHEHGMVSKEGVRVLVTAVDVSGDRPDPVMEVSDICILWTQSKRWTSVREKLVGLMITANNLYAKAPREPWRLRFYKIATNKWFDIVVYIVIILNIIPILCDLFVPHQSFDSFSISLKVINTLFFLFYFCEFLIKVCAFYFRGYFKSHWNKLDFAILLIAVVDLIMDYLELISFYESATFTPITTATILLRALRLLRLLRLLRASVPKVISFIDSHVDHQMSLGYDVGKGFVSGEEEVVKVLPQIADHKKIFEELKAKIDYDRLYVTKQLGLMQRDRPWIAITVKSRQAIRSILNSLRFSIVELKEGGMLDDVEYNKLIVVLEDKIKYLSTHLKLIEPCPPDLMLKEVSWIVGDDAVADFLLEHAALVAYNFGDHLVKDGETPTSVYILVSGLVKLTYIPKEVTLENLAFFGALPNIEICSSLRYDETQDDYVVSGNVIGELGALTGRQYDVNITCESSVQAYQIPITVIHQAFQISDHPIQGLRARMWKSVSNRLASVILLDVPAYQSWAQERIKYHLERAFVPNLDNMHTFIVNDLMEDLILIEGQVMDVNNRTIYVAPTYIPRTVHRIAFPNSSLMNVKSPITTKLLIIPTIDIDAHDIMETKDGAMVVSGSSSKCLQHSIRSRISTTTGNTPTKKTRSRNLGWNMFGLNKQRPRVGMQNARSSMSNNLVSPRSTSSFLVSKNRVHPESDNPKNDNIVGYAYDQATLPQFRESAPPVHNDAALVRRDSGPIPVHRESGPLPRDSSGPRDTTPVSEASTPQPTETEPWKQPPPEQDPAQDAMPDWLVLESKKDEEFLENRMNAKADSDDVLRLSPMPSVMADLKEEDEEEGDEEKGLKANK